jgi:L-2-hydroxyglutarate oxidase
MNHNGKYEVLIIGGGIVGLASSMAILKKKPLSLALVEKENQLAAHQTGNNSGVIHSGLYYKPGSLKARNCTLGRDLLYEFCHKHQIPHQQCGKLVVATAENELPRMEDLFNRGVANGLSGIRMLSSAELQEYEPHVAGIAGMFVPQTGIVDYVQVSEKFAQISREKGADIRLGEQVLRIHHSRSGLVAETNQGEIHCQYIINCAGLHSDRIAKMAGAAPSLKIIPFRGEYYKISQSMESLVRGLIYPVPDPKFPFLGVHFTRMIGGGVEAGPNAVLAFKREGYKKTSFSIGDFADTMTYPGALRLFSKHWRMGLGEMYRSWNKNAFVRALQRLIPEIEKEHLDVGGAGVRAQALEASGFLVDDFRIISTKRIIHVLNTPSPAATASISIGQSIAGMAFDNFQL